MMTNYCLCGKYNCILTSLKSLKEYRNNLRLKKNTKRGCVCKNCNSVSRHSIEGAINFKVERHVTGKHACDLVKIIMEQTEDVRTLLINNEIYHEDHKKVNKTISDVHSKIMKCRAVAKKALLDNVKLNKQLNRIRDREDDLLKSNRSLRKELKNLRKEMSRMKVDTLCTSDEDEDEEDGEDEDDEDRNVLEEVFDEQITDRMDGTMLDFFIKYETMLDYMRYNNVSLTRICDRNNRARGPIRDIFFSYKRIRNDFAHPNIGPRLKDDREFLEYVEDKYYQ